MQSHFCFCSRSDDRFRELLVLFHTFRKFYATDFAYAVFVSTPCASAKIATYDHFYRETFAEYSHCNHWVGSGEFPVRTDVCGCIQEFCCNLIQHLSFIRDTFGQHYIKGRNTVGSYHYELFAIDVVHITHFSVVHTFLSRKVEICFC